MSESEYDYEYQSDRSRRGASSSGEEESDTGSIPDEFNAGGSGPQRSSLQLCPTHPAGEMVEACNDCSKALELLRPEVAKQMLAPLSVSSVVSRYAGRSDEKTPTMLFSDATLDLAFNTFTQGRFRGKTHFRDLVDKYLTLPPKQHERLVQDLQLEPLFRKLENEKRFKYIFDIRRRMGDCQKNLRLSQRPIFQVISLVDSCLASFREFGAAAGMKFKTEATVRLNPKVPKPLKDSLAFEIDPASLLPLPELPSMLHGVAALSTEDADVLVQNEQKVLNVVSGYRDHVVSLVQNLFETFSQKLNDMDDFLAFYCDLYGHVDACFRDLIRDKLANCFKSELRPELLGKTLHTDDKEGSRNGGLLGGEERIRTALGNATKRDDLLKKSLLPKRTQPVKKKSVQQSPSKSANRQTRSPVRERYGGRKRGNEDSSSRSRKVARGSKRKDDEDEGSPKARSAGKKSAGKKKGKFLSPQSFSEAWPSFFSPLAIMLVTSVGLVVENIPKLEDLPLGGRLRYCIDSWRHICQNNWVNNVVEFGYRIPLKYKPTQWKIPSNPPVSESANEVLKLEALELKLKQAVRVVDHVKEEYISSYFAVPKVRSPGKFRPILNLKYFNKCVKKYRFTMEHLRTVREWIRPGAWCVGLDLKDAYPHIPIHCESRKYLRFTWLDELLEWVTLPFGLTCSPRVLTKVIKPIIAFLRSTWNILISIYMDDMIVQGKSEQEVIFHAQLVMLTFMALGWSFNFKKCSLIPSQNITHLGFDIDTVSMTISCPKDKILRLQEKCQTALLSRCLSVHDLERLLGTMESVRPSTPLAALHYRSIQKQLLCSKMGKRNPKKVVQLNRKSVAELKWWTSTSGFAANSSSFISEQQPSVHIWTDANLIMGGARNSRGKFTQRSWSSNELDVNPHINLLEIRAAREGIDKLAVEGDKVRLHIDNITACSYIRKQGGTRSSNLSDEACLLWEEALARNILILTPHWLSSKDNIEADFLSRNKLNQWEFYIRPSLFEYILRELQVYPTLDAFASRSTTQLERYMSWFPDSQAVAQDALLHQWDEITYLFPPVPLMLKVLRLVREQGISAVLVCPQWPTALWWPSVVEMMVGAPLPLPYYKEALVMVGKGNLQPFLDPLVAVHISAKILPQAIDAQI